MPGLSPIQQTILPDILGFAPQLLVDDLLDIGYDAIAKATGALETYLDTNWLPGRPIEDQNEAYAGLVAFQTLLQSHLDKAFDAFELWSLKNVFALPNPEEVPIVLPHQTGLDLTATEQEENALNKEIEELRAKVDAQKRLKARMLLAVRLSNARTATSEARLEKLRFLSTVKDTVSLPEEIQTLLNRVTSLPSAPPPTIDAPDPTQPVWTTHAGYMDWAVKTNVEREEAAGKGSGKGKAKEATMVDAEEELRTFGEAGDLVGAKRVEG
ncbi:hypothetical protein FRC04_004053 [Tulasnella sp. 424]|nr:hypothetical protein FRC04_004053 [Tulasnella sp. 424]KAG8964594.1 hypothetical protein FRC05_003759 [Tulasnella sp. 425]